MLISVDIVFLFVRNTLVALHVLSIKQYLSARKSVLEQEEGTDDEVDQMQAVAEGIVAEPQPEQVQDMESDIGESEFFQTSSLRLTLKFNLQF